MKYYRLVYTSLAAGHLTETAIDEILQTAQLNNALSDISGVLIFDGVRFAQVLEGPQPGVKRLFNAIEQDRRHRDVSINYTTVTDRRQFAGWEMAFVQDKDELLMTARDNFEGLVTTLVGTASNHLQVH